MLELICGWEPREAIGYAVAEFSAIRRTSEPLRFVPLMEQVLRYRGLYKRQHEDRDGQVWDVVSNAPMATSFAISRFLTPWLAGTNWVLFCDFVDMMFLADPAALFALRDDRYAIMVVKREHIADETSKMDGQAQTYYRRKNWSSVTLWNIGHPANSRLTLDMVNHLPGRDLHAFCWLEDEEIGALPMEWNHLVGIDHALGKPPALLHFTLGIPTMPGYENGPWSEEWLTELAILDATRGAVRAA